MTSPFWIIKKILRIVAIALPFVALTTVFMNVGVSKAATVGNCSVTPNPYNSYTTGTTSHSIAMTNMVDPFSGFYNQIVVSNGAHAYQTITNVAVAGFTTNALPNGFDFILSSPTPRTGDATLTFTFESTSTSFGFLNVYITNTAYPVRQVICSVGTTPSTSLPPVAGHTVFPTSSVTQYGEGVVNFIKSNIRVIVGILAFSLSIIWTVSMFSSSATKGSIDKVKMLSSDGFGSGGSPKYSTKHPYDDWSDSFDKQKYKIEHGIK